jgi:hypothetical protein
MAWKYGMILVEIADDGEETCELVELYDMDEDGHHEAFCRARVMSPEELAAAAEDVERDGVNRWFFENGDFVWQFSEERSWWNWKKREQ